MVDSDTFQGGKIQQRREKKSVSRDYNFRKVARQASLS